MKIKDTKTNIIKIDRPKKIKRLVKKNNTRFRVTLPTEDHAFLTKEAKKYEESLSLHIAIVLKGYIKEVKESLK